MIKAVYVPVDMEEPFEQVDIDEKFNRDVSTWLGDACVEYHVTHYNVRKQLPTEEMRKLHENLLFMCDEDGFHKQLPLNRRASGITGLRMIGPVVFMYEDEDGHRDLSPGELTGILGAVRKLHLD